MAHARRCGRRGMHGAVPGVLLRRGVEGGRGAGHAGDHRQRPGSRRAAGPAGARRAPRAAVAGCDRPVHHGPGSAHPGGQPRRCRPGGRRAGADVGVGVRRLHRARQAPDDGGPCAGAGHGGRLRARRPAARASTAALAGRLVGQPGRRRAGALPGPDDHHAGLPAVRPRAGRPAGRAGDDAGARRAVGGDGAEHRSSRRAADSRGRRRRRARAGRARRPGLVVRPASGQDVEQPAGRG